MKSIIIPAFVILSSLTFASAKEMTYTIDPSHTATVFSWNHLGYSTPSANFKGINGEIMLDQANMADAKVNVVINADNINSNDDIFDDKLKSSEWFDTEKFPEITFKSNKIIPLENDQYQVYGILTIKGITKEISLQAKLNQKGLHPMANKEAVGFNATTKFNRSDFNMGAFVPAVSDEITVNITVEAIAKE